MNNQSLVKFTKEKIVSNEQLQAFIVNSRTVANVVFPETLPFSDSYCRLGVEVVTVDIKNDRDVYKNESGGYSLHLSKLNEIAKAAKIRVIDSRILERKTDEKGKVTFISHQVKVQYRTVAGEMISETFTGKYDYFRDLEKYSSEKQIKSRRSHAEALAESNALTRAFNKVLPQLPQSFDAKELEKPFLIPYVEEDKEMALRDLPADEQLEVKRLRARKALGLMDDIYPANAGSQTQTKQIEDAQVITDEVKPDNSKPPEKGKYVPTPEEQNHINAETFLEAPQKERTEKILNLIKLKDFKDPNNSAFTEARIEKASIKDQVKFIEKLLNMPDAEEGLPV